MQRGDKIRHGMPSFASVASTMIITDLSERFSRDRAVIAVMLTVGSVEASHSTHPRVLGWADKTSSMVSADRHAAMIL